MGISDFFSDLYSSMGFPEAHADAPSNDDDDGSKEEGGDEDKGDDEGKGEDNEGGDDKEEGAGDEGGEEEGEEEGGEAEEEEEEEEDEPVDPKGQLEEECARSAQCSGYRHHYDECVERVTYQNEHPEEFKPHHKEDCVEEFFHLQHCATQCAAPKLFKMLK